MINSIKLANLKKAQMAASCTAAGAGKEAMYFVARSVRMSSARTAFCGIFHQPHFEALRIVGIGIALLAPPNRYYRCKRYIGL